MSKGGWHEEFQTSCTATPLKTNNLLGNHRESHINLPGIRHECRQAGRVGSRSTQEDLLLRKWNGTL